MIEVPVDKIKPRTNLGYTLGINRDKDIIRDPRQRNVFAQSQGRIRMAGDIDIFGAASGDVPTKTIRGSDLGLYRTSRALRSAPFTSEQETIY